jgi:dolichol kinase
MLEYIRLGRIWVPGIDSMVIEQFLLHFTLKSARHGTRSWDNGPLILSHEYLLLGTALPIWFVDNYMQGSWNLDSEWMLVAFSGLISIGIADALASLCGRCFGRHRWMTGTTTNKKTIEGSVGNFMGLLLGWSFISAVINQNLISTNAIQTAIGTTLLEAFSSQNDNLLIPCWMVMSMLRSISRNESDPFWQLPTN